RVLFRSFERFFAGPLGRYRQRLGPLIFEFGTFNRKTFKDVGEFLARLDPFLASLPGGFRYAIEIRNADYLCPDYLACSRRGTSPTSSTPEPGCRRSKTSPGSTTPIRRTSRSSGRCWPGAAPTSRPSSPSSPTARSRTRTRARGRG